MKEQQYVTSVEGQSMQRFGNYDLIRRLAVGGMGEVYLARQRTAFGREVAIKIIRPELIQDSITHQRFLREAKVSAHLKHEHILPLIEFNEEQGRLFLVTPYIEGGTLSARLQQGPISLLEVRQLFVALVQAVAYIHKSGVIHRDLKPSNILLDQGSDGQVYVRLIDFGIARLQGDEEESPQLTTDGIEVGTAEYMAPERLAGVAEPSNDIYSLGVILYLLLAGRLPSIKPRASIPPALDSIVYRCMALNPADRFASADELLKAFTQAYRQFNNPLFHVMNANVAGVDVEDAPTARGDWSQGQARLKQQVGPSLVSLENSGEVATTQTANPAASTSSPVRASHPSRPATGFERTDYDAPTSRVTLHPEVKSRSGAVPVVKKPVVKKNPARKSRGISLLAVFSVLIVLIILVIVGILALGLPSLSAVQVNIRPQEQVVNQVFQMTANPTSQKINVPSATIPATQLTETRSSSLKGPTTGVSCIFFCLGGHRTVSASDVDTLTAQLKQSLVSQIAQDLQGQLRAKGALENSNMPMHFVDLSGSAVPPVGSQSDNVTVTLAEQGATEAVLSSDAQTLAKQLLSQRASGLGSNFKLVPSSIQIGQPVVTNIDPTGVVSLKVAAGGVAEYQFPPTQLRGMSEQLKGLSVKDATNFLKSQPGVDRSSVALHFTMGTGDALPTDPQQIKITPVVPVNLPTVQLTVVPTVALPTGQGTGVQGQSTPPPDQQLPTSTPGDN